METTRGPMWSELCVFQAFANTGLLCKLPLSSEEALLSQDLLIGTTFPAG